MKANESHVRDDGEIMYDLSMRVGHAVQTDLGYTNVHHINTHTLNLTYIYIHTDSGVVKFNAET